MSSIVEIGNFIEGGRDAHTNTHTHAHTQGCVHGVLMISTSAVLFKPNKSDTLVQEHGSSEYEVLIPLCDISHASITRDVALPRRSVSVCVSECEIL